MKEKFVYKLLGLVSLVFTYTEIVSSFRVKGIRTQILELKELLEIQIQHNTDGEIESQ